MSSSFSNAWQNLFEHRKVLENTTIRQMFSDDPKRFDSLSVEFEDMLVDFSKNLISVETITLLEHLAQECNLEEKRDEMFSGKPINFTENRPALHTALRNQSDAPIMVNGRNVMDDVREVLANLRKFSSGIRNGSISNKKGQKFADVVNIGIGGSDLGPAMATLALVPYHDGPKLHFVSNIDGSHISDTLAGLNPETTMFLVASKTFTTIETMTNAQSARRWISESLGEDSVAYHFAAVSTALDKVEEFGIGKDRVFGFWDWVGGRYSIWSAIGLPLMIAVGAEDFDQFLRGGHSIDQHFLEAPIHKNLPILMGMLGIWYRNVWKFPTRAVLPYDQRLSRFPAYLQQLDMESNGKQATASGVSSQVETGPVVWGEPGTNGQHAFYQLIHQGTTIVPAEFLIGLKSHEPDLSNHHNLLMANCLAQSEALMLGLDENEVCKRLVQDGMSESDARKLALHKSFPGNRPSTTIVYEKLTPYALGRLIALYEHRVFVEGAVWNINSFDQWGVELGKELARKLLPMIEGSQDSKGKDASTLGLLNKIKSVR